NEFTGLLATANNHVGAYISITVARSSFTDNSGFAILAQGNLGQVLSGLSDNAVADEAIVADGAVSLMRVGGTSGTGTISCTNAATLQSYGDNRVSTIDTPSCTFSVVGGK